MDTPQAMETPSPPASHSELEGWGIMWGSQSLADMAGEELADDVHSRVGWLAANLPHLGICVLVLVGGCFGINLFVHCLHKMLIGAHVPHLNLRRLDSDSDTDSEDHKNHVLKGKKINPTMLGFAMEGVSLVLRVVLLLVAGSIMGIHTNHVVAAAVAIVIAILLAAQGVLQDGAKGVVVVIFQPFKVGDLIIVNGTQGRVKKVMLFHTYLLSPDAQLHVIPNRKMVSITNLTAHGKFRLDVPFMVSNDEDFLRVKALMKRVTEGEQMCLEEPPPSILVSDITAEGTECTVRAWVKSCDLLDWPLVIREAVKFAFVEEKILIPQNIWTDPRQGQPLPISRIAGGAMA